MSNIQQIAIHQFDPNTMRQGCRYPATRILGKCGTGKTVLASHLAEQLAAKRTYVIDPAHETYTIYNAIPVENRFQDVSDSWFRYLEYVKKQKFAKRELSENDSVTVIVDGHPMVFSNDSSRYSNYRKTLFAHNRLLLINTITTEQYPADLTPLQLSHTEYIFIFRQASTAAYERIYEQYRSVFPSFSMFYQTLEQLTEDPFTCMVLDLTKYKAPLEETVFWYRAVPKLST